MDMLGVELVVIGLVALGGTSVSICSMILRLRHHCRHRQHPSPVLLLSLAYGDSMHERLCTHPAC
jgi:hypothetical protein